MYTTKIRKMMSLLHKYMFSVHKKRHLVLQ